MRGTRGRVAVTRDDKGEGSVSSALERAGFIAIAIPMLIEGPAPNQQRLEQAAHDLESFDLIICASARAVRAISEARGSRWPAGPRAAAVGPATAAAMRDAGASDPVVADTFTARALLDRLRSLGSWRGRRVLISTVTDGRRDLIEGLRADGALVTELEAYSMTPRDHDEVRRDWNNGKPDAVILGSANAALHLVDAVGIGALHGLKAIVPIGPTTAAALDNTGLRYQLPEQATFAAAVAKLESLLIP